MWCVSAGLYIPFMLESSVVLAKSERKLRAAAISEITSEKTIHFFYNVDLILDKTQTLFFLEEELEERRAESSLLIANIKS